LQAKSQKILKLKKQLLDFLAFDHTLNKWCFKQLSRQQVKQSLNLLLRAFGTLF